jgi:hypothetical protein
VICEITTIFVGENSGENPLLFNPVILIISNGATKNR